MLFDTATACNTFYKPLIITAMTKKANEQMLARFFEEMMQATETTCWDIVCKYKAATTTTEMTEESAA